MKINKGLGLAFLAIVLLGTNSLSQKKILKYGTPKRIDRNKPSVYLSFVPASLTGRATGASKDESRIWFRLHNNLPLAIWLNANDAGEGSEEVVLFYDLVDSDDRPVTSTVCHVCSTIMLGKGKSILFSVSREKYSNSSAFRVQFSYPWEDAVAVMGGLEPKHFVYFYFDHMPEAGRRSSD